MGNHQKNILRPLRYPNPSCTLSMNDKIDMWPHVLSTCTCPHIEGLHVAMAQQSNTPNSPHIPIQQKPKVLYMSKFRQRTKPNPRHHNYEMVNTMHMPPQHMHMHGLAKTQHIMYTRAPHRYLYTYPPNPPNTIKFIELIYYHDRFPNIAIGEETNKYTPSSIH